MCHECQLRRGFNGSGACVADPCDRVSCGQSAINEQLRDQGAGAAQSCGAMNGNTLMLVEGADNGWNRPRPRGVKCSGRRLHVGDRHVMPGEWPFGHARHEIRHAQSRELMRFGQADQLRRAPGFNGLEIRLKIACPARTAAPSRAVQHAQFTPTRHGHCVDSQKRLRCAHRTSREISLECAALKAQALQ
jgi:hypothetical protein